MKPGDKLGPYEILAPIGAGGMGQVYRARDTRLGRDVAIKISNENFSERFESEARSIAALNHPHICHLYDVGPNYLVMELIDGAPLKGPLPIKKAVEYAEQILEALDAAHTKGITHRDLKPANILVTKSGIKLLDFGLAKQSAPLKETDATQALTQQGAIVGTLNYMSPEQLQSKEPDGRSDIFSFGLLFYEMLTGKRVFEAVNPASLIAAILDRPAPSIAELAPPALDQILNRCLAKDPEERWQSTRDLRAALDLGMLPKSPERVIARPLALIVAWTAACVFAAIAGVFAFLQYRQPAPDARSLSATILPPEGASFDFTNGLGLPTLSPDGTKVVFGARTADGRVPLWVRALDSLVAKPLAGTDRATFPFWSPDSRSIGFFADGKLKRIDAAGGPALTLADSPNGRGASWSPLGVIVFSPSNIAGVELRRVSASGGDEAKLAESDARFPWFLPDGRHFLYELQVQRPGSDGSASIHIASLDGGPDATLLQTNSNAVYSEGHLLFIRDHTLMAQAFDPRRLKVAADATPVAEQVQAVLNSRTAGVFSVSENGILAYRSGAGGDSVVVTWLDRSGKHLSIVGDPVLMSGNWRLSPDEKTLALSLREHANADIWTLDLTRGLRTRLTFNPGADLEPVWSPDRRTIVFSSSRTGRYELYRKPSNGTGEDELLFADGTNKIPLCWSPDGKVLLYSVSSGDSRGHIWGLPISPTQPGSPIKPIPVMRGQSNEGFGQFSPDGRWIAFISSESGENDLFVIPFPPTGGGKRLVAPAALAAPRWRKDGKEIFFVSRDRRLMSAELAIRDGAIEVGHVRPLFGPIDEQGVVTFEVTGDGQRFLVPVVPDQKTTEPLTLIQNWAAGLKR